VEDSVLFKEMIQTGLPLSIADVRVDPRFPSLLEPENLSWLGIPLIVKSELIGVMALEGHEPDFYTPDHIQVAKTFASQAAIALENARLFEDSLGRAAELDQRSQRLALLNRLSVDLSASLDVDYILKLTAQQLLSALNGSRVAVVLTGENGQNSLHLEVPVGAEILPRVLPDNPLMVRLQESQGIFISSDIKNEPELVSLAETYFAQRGSNSLFVIPLVTGSNLLGWFWLQMDESYRFTVPEIELARTISNQAAIAVQNARQYAETTRLTEDLEHRVADRTAEFRREHQNTQTLLRIITELSTSLDMDQVLNRTLSVLNDELPAEQSMVILSQGSGRVYQAGLPLVGQTDGADKSKNRIEQEIARWVVRKRVPALVDDIRSDSRWTVADDVGISFKSVLAVPLAMGEDILGALLLFHSNEAFFLIEQVGVVEATARQIGIALSNSELFNLIRDQSERLGGMLREQQIEASRSRAILEAVADGVVVTDAKNCITLFNVSAERILDLKSSQVVGQSLEQFSGLFGHAARHWMQTIREWTKDPTVYKEGQTYAEQISLDNDRVVAIHLAPVIWRNAFLGTVSIFRDITHEVQVDRLKSEFVANVSHELRTPMTSIKGYVEIMLMGAAGELTPQQTHFMQIVRSNIQRLGVLVNDLLDISRIETGRVTLSIQSLDLQEIAEDVISDIQRRSQEENKPMEFSIEAAEELPRVKADQERIRQVLGSLVNNGYAYTPENGRVIIKMHSLDDEVQVDVQDNGVGILIKDQPRIFERFYRGEDPLVLASSGNGLGLAISKTIVEMHQGRIWFYSKGIRGEGSTFSFTIPVYRPEE
jgi:PAS domain S-box-containing protein